MKLFRLTSGFAGFKLALWPGLSLVLVGFVAFADQEPVALSATNMGPTVQLRSAIQVDGEGVFLHQLLETGAEVPQLRLCDAPACGKVLVLKRAEIADLARGAGSETTLTNWSGPDSTRIARRLRVVGEKEGLQLLRSVLQQQYVKEQGELELRLSRPWTSISVPDEPFVFKVQDLPTTGVTPNFIVRFEVETARGEVMGSWQASLMAKVWREIWVARSPLKRGESVRGSDLIRERRDMLLCREALAEFAPDDGSLQFAEPVPTGTPLLARLVKPRALVRRGQTLAAMVQDGTLMITLKVEALEDGALGQIIRVRNPLSRRDLHGKVMDEQNILVSL